MLKEDNSLSSESAGEEDEDRAWNDSLSELSGLGLPSLLVLGDVFAWVPILELLSPCFPTEKD